MSLKELMDKMPTAVSLGYARSEPSAEPSEEDPCPPPKEVVVVLSFSEKGFGFGEVTVVQTAEGVFLDTECMSLERVKRYFAALLDQAITDGDEDPEKHRLYNRVMQRTCGDHCGVCHG